MNNEELITIFVNRLNINDIKEANQYEAELLRLLDERDELEKEVERLKQEWNNWQDSCNRLESQLASAQRAVEAISKIKLIFGSTHLLSWKEQAEVRYVLELYYSSSCQCPACTSGVLHASDCAVHNMPAYPNGECNCGADTDGLTRKEREVK